MNNENIYRRLILDAVGGSYLKTLGHLNETNSINRIAKVLLYFFIFFAIYFYFIYTGSRHLVLFLLPCWLIALINFNRINVITHDASHFLMFRNKKTNDAVTNFFASYFAMHDVNQYRLSHLVHHRSLHTEIDPDKEFYTLGMKVVLEDLFLITFIKQLFSNTSKTKKSIFAYLFQLLILGIFFLINKNAVDSVFHYVLFFLYPLISVFVLILRIRTHIQHYSENKDVITRTTTPRFLEKLFIGQKMEYHLEHHLFPGIPYYNLEALHHRLCAGVYENAELRNLITKTYFADVH